MALTSTEEAQLRALIAQQAALLSLAGNETTITSKLSATKVNLSGIAAASSLADTDLTLVRQGANDKSSSLTVLKTWITNSMAAIATASGFAVLFATNGYIKLPSWLGGWIAQWGIAAGSASEDVSISFPISFTSAVRSVLTSTTTTGLGYISNCNSPTTSGFKLATWSAVSTRVVANSFWMAVGN